MADVLQFPIRRSTAVSSNLLEFALSGDFEVPVPDALRSFHLASRDERRRRIRRTLIRAWAYWRWENRKLVEAVREAANGGAEGEYALIQMRCVLMEINLVAWEAHPARLRADVHSLFRRAIGRVTPHRGGWAVDQPETQPEV